MEVTAVIILILIAIDYLYIKLIGSYAAPITGHGTHVAQRGI